MHTRLARRVVATMAIALLSVTASAASPVVGISSGRIQGRSLGDGVTAYLGLPYAAAPVGSLRWRPPGPAPHWTGVRQATGFGADCLQLPMEHPPGAGFVNPTSEDCLFLNVWAPPRASAASLPVMVWIHGGAWIMGAGSWPTYNGEAFARDGIILVTINYRLGRFGFFSHPALTRESPRAALSNYGLMDQIAALKWVKQNIAAFGGDPRNVTIFGESAGGRSVNLLMSLPAARGLFQKAISESGGGENDLAERPSAEEIGAAWARSMGLPGDVSAADLRALSAAVVLDLKHFAKWPLPAPVIDGRLVARQVDAVFLSGRQAKVPYLAGFNSYEQSLLRWLPDAANEELRQLGAYRREALSMYWNGSAADRQDAKQELYGEATRAAPARLYARLVADAGKQAWLYRYSYVAKSMRGKVPGAVHGAEVGLVFHNETAPSSLGENRQDAAMASMIHGYWVSFAKTGDPNRPGYPVWPRYQRSTDRILEFTNHGVHASSRFHAQRLDLFDKAFLFSHNKPQP